MGGDRVVVPEPQPEPVRSAIWSPLLERYIVPGKSGLLAHNGTRLVGETDVPTPPNNRAGSIGIRRLLTLVSARDTAIVSSVGEFRFVTTTHLQALHFSAHASIASARRATTRVLQRLAALRLIRSLDRKRGGDGGGSSSYIWRLDVAGERLVRHLNGDTPAHRRRVDDRSEQFIEHSLAVSDMAVAVVSSARAGLFELLDLRSEPASWRSFPSGLGEARTLKPDLAATTASADEEFFWFIEVDRGTESLPTLLRKCTAYTDHWRSGIAQRDLGTYPRVLWLMPTERRAKQLAAAIHADRQLPSDLFTVVPAEDGVGIIQESTRGPLNEGGSS